MRPNQRHYVLTLGPSLVFGKHFINGENILQTCCGVVHSFVSDSIVTNTSHPELLHYLVSFLSYWSAAYDQKARRKSGYCGDELVEGEYLFPDFFS